MQAYGRAHMMEDASAEHSTVARGCEGGQSEEGAREERRSIKNVPNPRLSIGRDSYHLVATVRIRFYKCPTRHRHFSSEDPRRSQRPAIFVGANAEVIARFKASAVLLSGHCCEPVHFKSIFALTSLFIRIVKRILGYKMPIHQDEQHERSTKSLR